MTSDEGLRLRKHVPETTSISADEGLHKDPLFEAKSDEVVWGKTPGGEVFRVPTTHDVLTLFNPTYPKSHFDLLNLTLLGSQLVLFAVLPAHVSKVFFLLYFAFWRAAYDVGLGWVLTKQSKKKWIVREVQRRGWLDEKRRPNVRSWIRKQLAGKMGKDYSFDELPLEYNTWLLFRQVVDVILLNDFVAYCMFAFSCFRTPTGLSMTMHLMRWFGGIVMIAFNLWVKTQAHDVVKDYGWYWGDVFFQRGALVFDGVFELAPHPMYSVGYAGYYGLSLIVGSYPVLFVSLAAHAAQFGFLVFFENPHIERTYGQRKLLAARTHGGTDSRPVSPSSPADLPHPDSLDTIIEGPIHTPTLSRLRSLSGSSTASASTPTDTDADTATDSELETETEEITDLVRAAQEAARLRTPRSSPQMRASAPRSISHAPSVTSHHDLLHRYFRKDTILLHNLDWLRASDQTLILTLLYALFPIFLPTLSPSTTRALHVAHALTWCLIHSFGLGLLLNAQSNSKFLVRHFLKHYSYPQNDRGDGAVEEAFANWKVTFNVSTCMTYVSFVGLVWNTYTFPKDWTVGDDLLRHTLGAILLSIHGWTAMECYEVLGAFGWFFGDFFLEGYPTQLEYTGIYRYLNNPEILSVAAFFGLALISGSKLPFALAVVSALSHWWFLSYVERPHMRKLYGESLRKEAGFTKVMKKVALRNALLLEQRLPAASRHAPEFKRVAKEVEGTFDKVAEAVEEFLNKSKPRLSEVMQDTKVLLQQSRERLVITRVANDLSLYDSRLYRLQVLSTRPRENGVLRFHLGEPIPVRWRAPVKHSRKDWMGIYRVGANKSKSVTKTSSLGWWVPVHDEEWDGDVALDTPRGGASTVDSEEGEVVFKGNTLPWKLGTYELRYHHAGKYNVMGIEGPIEIYVDRLTSLDFVSIRSALLRVIALCLDSDPSLLPLSVTSGSQCLPDADTREHDDFRFWSEAQAKRIAIAIEAMFGVEYSPKVILADANVSSLANKILLSKELLSA